MKSIGSLVFVSVASAVVFASPDPVAAQVSPLQVEVRTGVYAPKGAFRDGETAMLQVDRGLSYGVQFGLTQGLLTWYVGFSEHRAECVETNCAAVGGGRDDEGPTATGWDLGARINLLRGPVVPWLRMGATAQIVDAKVRDPLADPLPGQWAFFRSDSGRAWGYELGGGLTVRLVERLALSPAVRYSRFTPAFEAGPNTDVDVRMTAWVFDMGLVLGF